MFRVAQRIVGASGPGQDRAVVLAIDGGLVLAVADGAGNSGRGAHAAEAALRLLTERVAAGERDAAALLRVCDRALADEGSGGETTMVVVIVEDQGVTGASAGDSEAWLIEATGHHVLTQDQNRKPLLGSGRAEPVAFAAGPLTATLLLGSDGFFKYTDGSLARQLAIHEDLDAIPDRMIDSVRLRSGTLQDDTTVLVCRRSIRK